MNLHEQIARSLTELRGFASDVPTTVGWSADGGPTVEVDFTAVESLGCAFRELRVAAAELRDGPFDTLKTWADQICQKINYLLEPLRPLEIDAQSQVVLVRSAPPEKNGEQTSFYELQIASTGALSLRRYVCFGRDAQRESSDIRITHEVLVKLVSDLIAAIPPAAAE